MRLSFNLIQKSSRKKRKWIVSMQVLKQKILQATNGSHTAARGAKHHTEADRKVEKTKLLGNGMFLYSEYY